MAGTTEQSAPVLSGIVLEGETSTLDQMLEGNINPLGDANKQTSIEKAIVTLAEQAIDQSKLISDDTLETIQSMISVLDKRLSDQVNEILHHEKFQKIESSWRGLHYLVNNSETDKMLKIRVFNISKKELGKTIKKYKGARWDQSPVFQKVYRDEFDMLGGHPYGCLVGDYYFDHSAQDVELLEGMSKIAAAAHAPFITAPSPSLMGMQTWQELPKPADLTKLVNTPQHTKWNALRDSEDSRYLGLAMPRFLGRLPYGAKTNPVEDFAFEEDVDGSDHQRYSWVNAAYAMARNINVSFKLYGWCTSIRGVSSGGVVEDLPIHTFPSDDGGVDIKCPTEVAIDGRREGELSKSGLMALQFHKHSDFAAFIGGQSLQKPIVYDDPDATANAKLATRLPYMFATSRFAHYLKTIVRQNLGSFKEREDMEDWLNKWISQYVLAGAASAAGDNARARKPLSEAKVIVEEVEGNPGYYTSKIYLRPHYQLEGLTVSLGLVSKMPSVNS